MANPIDVTIDPLAVISFGFIGNYIAATEGLALNTFGFLWPLQGNFTECSVCNDDVQTTWTDCTGC